MSTWESNAFLFELRIPIHPVIANEIADRGSWLHRRAGVGAIRRLPDRPSVRSPCPAEFISAYPGSPQENEPCFRNVGEIEIQNTQYSL